MITIISNKNINYRIKLFESISKKEFTEVFFYESFINNTNNDFKKYNFLKVIQSLMKSRKLILLRDIRRPDLVILSLIAKLLGVEVILWGSWLTKNNFANFLRVLWSNIVDKNIFYSKPISYSFIERGLSAKKIIYSINNSKTLKSSILAQNDRDKNSICFVGSLNKRKGLTKFICELDKISQNKNLIINFNIIGDGEEFLNISQLKPKKINLIMHGRIESLSSKIEILKKSNIFVSPSQVGLSLVDALASAVPVFTVNNAISGGEIDSLVDGYNSKLYENFHMLAKGLIFHLNDKKELNLLQDGAFETYNNLYNWNNYINGFTQ